MHVQQRSRQKMDGWDWRRAQRSVGWCKGREYGHGFWGQGSACCTSLPHKHHVVDGDNVETVSDFMFLGSKITADSYCSHEIKRCFLLGRKAMTNLYRVLKSRDITLPTKISLVKVMVFPLAMYGWERWAIKKAEHQRIDAFELWCWRRLLRVPWTERRSD